MTGPFLGIWLSYIAIQETRIGVASTIMSIPPLLLLPLGAIFLSERVTTRAVIGTVLALVGVTILFLSSDLAGLFQGWQTAMVGQLSQLADSS